MFNELLMISLFVSKVSTFPNSQIPISNGRKDHYSVFNVSGFEFKGIFTLLFADVWELHLLFHIDMVRGAQLNYKKW